MSNRHITILSVINTHVNKEKNYGKNKQFLKYVLF